MVELKRALGRFGTAALPAGFVAFFLGPGIGGAVFFIILFVMRKKWDDEDSAPEPHTS